MLTVASGLRFVVVADKVLSWQTYFSNICQSLLMGCRNLFFNLLKMDSEIFAFKMMDGN
jgi:hypothetical protein